MDELISRQAVIDCYKKWQPYMSTKLLNFEKELYCIPSVTPSYNSIKTELKPSEDCISRQDVIDEINRIYPDAYNNYNAYSELFNFIDDLPSVQPKIGRWIKNAEEWQNVDPPYFCSECGRASLRQENFCCSCGADMRGDDNADCN